MKESNYIGILHESLYHDELVTVGDLKVHLNERNVVYSPKQYCDWRYNTDLVRFSFDPYTGEKIDWKKIQNIIENDKKKEI